MKDVIQFFVLKSTMGKYFSLIKRGVIGGFFWLLNKAMFYQYVEVKGKIMKKGEVLEYWDPVDMSRCFIFCCIFYI